MKKLVLSLNLLVIGLSVSQAAEDKAVKIENSGSSEKTASFLSGIYLETVGVYRIPNVTETGEWGAGLELGVNLSKKVSLGVQNVGYRNPDNFGGILVDETSVVVHTTLFSDESGKLSLGVDASGVRQWKQDDWGFGVGPSLSYGFTPNFYASAAIQIRSFMDGDKDLYIPVGLGFSF